MIKELRVNLFRAFRMKSFYVILCILLAFSFITAFFIFFLTGDPLKIMSRISPQIEKQAGQIISEIASSVDESQSKQDAALSEAGFSPDEIERINMILDGGSVDSTYDDRAIESRILESDYTLIDSSQDQLAVEINGEKYYYSADLLNDPTFGSVPAHEGEADTGEPAEPNESSESFTIVIDANNTDEESEQYGSAWSSLRILFDDSTGLDSPWGAVSSMWSGGLSVFLLSVFVALFVGAEYKSRFHVNHYSANTSCRMILFCEWLSINFLILLIQIVINLLTIGFTYLMCPNFATGNLKDFLIRTFLVYLLTITFTSFSFMFAVLRRGSAMAIVFSSLLEFEVAHLVVEIASLWNSSLRTFSLNWVCDYLFTQSSISARSYLAIFAVSTVYLALFLGITLTVSSYRDAY